MRAGDAFFKQKTHTHARTHTLPLISKLEYARLGIGTKEAVVHEL